MLTTRPPSGSPNALRFVRVLRTFVLLAAFAAGIVNAAPREVTTIEWTPVSDGAREPAVDAVWQRFNLPLRWHADPRSGLQRAVLRIRFTAEDAGGRPWGVLLGNLPAGGEVEVNGRLVGAIPASSDETRVHWWRPHLVGIDPQALRAGDNELRLRLTYGGGSHVIDDLRIGALDDLRWPFVARTLLSVGLPWLGLATAALLALMFGVLWWRRREASIGMFAAIAALWAARSVAFVVEALPAGLQVPLLLLHYGGSGAFSALVGVSLLRACGGQRHREAWVAYGLAAIGPLVLLVGGSGAVTLLDRFWMPMLLVIPAMALLLGLSHRLRAAEAPGIQVIAAGALAIAAGLHDYGLLEGWIAHEGGLALHWAGPVLLFALATPLADRFLGMLREAESVRGELESRVREREQLLKRNFERLRESERGKAEAQERQRIMQDMHDGLGSQLLSSLMLVERGAATKEDVAQILRDAMDDLRLAIDALAPEDADLASALGNLRFRMEPRAKAAGMEFVWDARQLPVELDVNPDAVLPILRIVQEALTNALKHSKAKVVRVALSVDSTSDGQWLDIRVTDNGVGKAEERSGGRGLLNMRNRAGRIGAQLKLESINGQGTMVRLRYKLDPRFAGTSARASQTVLNTQAVIERARQQG